jgi:hypothetical protein
MGLSVLRSIKKALAIVPKLSPRIVMIDKSCAVIGYASFGFFWCFTQRIIKRRRRRGEKKL